MMAEYPHTTFTIGRLFIGQCSQGGGAPVIDSGHTRSVDGWTGGCYVVRLRRGPGRGVMVGLIGGRAPNPHRLARVPLLGLLFRVRF